MNEKKFAADIKVLLCFITVNLFSLAIWHNVYRKKDFIRHFIVKCEKLEFRFRSNLTSINTIIDSCLVLIALIITVSASFCIFHINLAPLQLKMYFSFFTFAKGQDTFSMLIKGTVIIIQFVCLLIPPAIAALLSGIVYFKTSDLLGKFRENLKNVKMDVLYHNEISKLFTNYNFLYLLVHEVEEEFSITIFMLLCSQWLNMNTVLLAYILYEGDLLSYSLGSLMIAQLIFAVILNVGVILCASRISYQVFRVQTALQVMYNRVGTVKSSPLHIVKNMLDIKFPVMTACGVLKLNPSLIATSFGSVLTYGLLVINVNRS
ncbi:uncharacterized protein CDAR_406641 [Caerostris darwini]|uniref:Gustatory receptor n=1 Tax=Caerostris darwini TaxID=1538125 RepID=A0AAV4R894_9ARAC|nr:uncharacterized protein CDAR_406641 [Caerostris darwini]